MASGSGTTIVRRAVGQPLAAEAAFFVVEALKLGSKAAVLTRLPALRRGTRALRASSRQAPNDALGAGPHRAPSQPGAAQPLSGGV